METDQGSGIYLETPGGGTGGTFGNSSSQFDIYIILIGSGAAAPIWSTTVEISF